MIRFKRHIGIIAGISILVLLQTVFNPKAKASDDALVEMGDYLRILLPAAGFAGTYVVDDPEGRIQFWQTWGSSVAITSFGKMKEKSRTDWASDISLPGGWVCV